MPPHGIRPAPVVKFWLEEPGHYKVVVDEVADNKRYTGSYEFEIDEQWGRHSSNTEALEINVEDVQMRRTIIFIYGKTRPGQDMFIRGGIDHDYANRVLGRNCATDNYECAMPIRHLNTRNGYTRDWKNGDTFLDWYGAESAQGVNADGDGAFGTALEWTTDNSSHGKTVARDGYGYTPLNDWGDHFWMLDVEIDCSKAVEVDGDYWFEFKSFISNGPGWERNIYQSLAPWRTNNHFAKCGMMNKYYMDSDSAEYFEID